MATNAQDPLEIFPLPVWECIFEQLRKEEGSSRDVLNCSKVCTEFQRILEPSKQEWLFESICPFILPYMKGDELMACRRICKNWRRGVDNFLEDFETWRPFNEETSDISRSTHYDPLLEKDIKWRKIKNEDELKLFLEAMKKQEMKTPFPGRSLTLGDFLNRGCDFLEMALKVLSLCGEQIWYLRVFPPKFDYDSCQFYLLVKQILGCTPNLKSLTLDYRGCDGDSYKDDKGRLKNLLEDHLPLEIISLETLEIYSRFIPPVVILEMLNSKINLGNLKRLKLHGIYIPKHKVEPFSMVKPLQHLTELYVSGFNWNDFEHIFNNIISPTAPLKKLILRFRGVFKYDGKVMDFDRLWNMINRWKGTLIMLAIKGNRNSSYGQPGKSLVKLDAPNLKSLELEGILFSAGFLPPALTRSLEYLHIRYNNNDIFDENWKKQSQGMELYKCVFDARKLHNSSIWREMKNLKIIRVEGPHPSRDFYKVRVACTREMHERGIPAKYFQSNFDGDYDDMIC